VAASASAVSWSGPGDDGGDEVMDSEFERGDELRSIFHLLLWSILIRSKVSKRDEVTVQKVQPDQS
jgi:hypothetical protein